MTQEPQDVFDPSNSIEHEEIVKITQGFRPDFNSKEIEFQSTSKKTKENK